MQCKLHEPKPHFFTENVEKKNKKTGEDRFFYLSTSWTCFFSSFSDFLQICPYHIFFSLLCFSLQFFFLFLLLQFLFSVGRKTTLVFFIRKEGNSSSFLWKSGGTWVVSCGLPAIFFYFIACEGFGDSHLWLLQWLWGVG